jgi:5'-methylthioadenosine phosphorylase
MEKIKIGIIGGSGLYDMAELEDREVVSVETPFGPPSDSLLLGSLRGKRVAFLARHGRGHRITPSELNFRANIYALKSLGVERILSASAVGSLRSNFAPLDIVLPDQFVDRTQGRISSFFGSGLVGHVAFADPICPDLAAQVQRGAEKIGIKIKKGGTYVCIEGPAFSTRAESRLYQSWGMDIIGMTNLQEAKLAREAEICYVTMALITDYDCWHDSHESVSVEMIVGNLRQNSRNAQSIILQTVRDMDEVRRCNCGDALKYALLTDKDRIPPETIRRLDCIVGKYLGDA